MVIQIDLLDALSMQAGCQCLSDLKCLEEWQRARLVHVLERTPADAAELKEWNDALNYLGQAPPEQTAWEAREHLIRALSRPR